MHLRRHHLSCVLLLALAADGAAAASALRVVALSGAPAPAAPPGAVFDAAFRPPVINAAGDVAFAALLRVGPGGVTADDNVGLYLETGAALTQIARTGQQPPGLPAGARFANFDQELVSLAEGGRVAFRATLGGGGGVNDDNDDSLWSTHAGPLELLARENSPAPAAPPGAIYRAMGPPKINSNGQVAFYGSMRPEGPIDFSNDRGIWSGPPAALSLVAQRGSQAPAAPAGVVYDVIDTPLFGRQGLVAFKATLSGPSVNGDNETSLWSSDAIAMRLIAREGAAAPGGPAGALFSHLGDTSNPSLSDAGRVAFVAGLRTGVGGVTADNNLGVWTEQDGGLTLFARKGDPAPSTPAGPLFANFSNPVLNADGDAAFIGTLKIGAGGVTEANHVGVWSSGGGPLALVARRGMRPPGTPPGITFFGINPPVINGAGQIAFGASLGQTTAPGITGQGIWAQDRDGVLRLIVRTGTSLELPGGDVRLINGLSFVGGASDADGARSGFNDLGQVVFAATFSDGSSGVFVSSVATVPEPSTAALASAAALALRRRRRRT